MPIRPETTGVGFRRQCATSKYGTPAGNTEIKSTPCVFRYVCHSSRLATCPELWPCRRLLSCLSGNILLEHTCRISVPVWVVADKLGNGKTHRCGTGCPEGKMYQYQTTLKSTCSRLVLSWCHLQGKGRNFCSGAPTCVRTPCTLRSSNKHVTTALYVYRDQAK